MVREILKLGDNRLYDISAPVDEKDWEFIAGWVNDLNDTLMNFRAAYGAGRAIAAPQIGIPKRLIYVNTDKPYVFVNPVMEFPDDETYELLDDCMSFPGLIVKVRRYRRAVIRYFDLNMCECSMELEGDMSELIQHEYDHLDGILATMRAIDNKSFIMAQMKREF